MRTSLIAAAVVAASLAAGCSSRGGGWGRVATSWKARMPTIHAPSVHLDANVVAVAGAVVQVTAPIAVQAATDGAARDAPQQAVAQQPDTTAYAAPTQRYTRTIAAPSAVFALRSGNSCTAYSTADSCNAACTDMLKAAISHGGGSNCSCTEGVSCK